MTRSWLQIVYCTLLWLFKFHRCNLLTDTFIDLKSEKTLSACGSKLRISHSRKWLQWWWVGASYIFIEYRGGMFIVKIDSILHLKNLVMVWKPTQCFVASVFYKFTWIIAIFFIIFILFPTVLQSIQQMGLSHHILRKNKKRRKNETGRLVLRLFGSTMF